MALSKEEESILESIIVASENDPNRPEFPAGDPKFPATPTYSIHVPGFSQVLLKDESHNPTGTHKDRMAWEIVVMYRDILLAKQAGRYEGSLPAVSICTMGGSAAIALQTLLQQYNLPSVRVLLDHSASKELIRALEYLGASVYFMNFKAKKFSWREILLLTNNTGGIDVSTSGRLDLRMSFYDWLSFEILNSNAEYCFIPFGSGHLYENVLNIAKRVLTGPVPDPRFLGKSAELGQCHYIGATTTNSYSIAEKLYSAHRPLQHFDEQWLSLYKMCGYCGKVVIPLPIGVTESLAISECC